MALSHDVNGTIWKGGLMYRLHHDLPTRTTIIHRAESLDQRCQPKEEKVGCWHECDDLKDVVTRVQQSGRAILWCRVCYKS